MILADGVNSMLGRSLDMVPASSAHHYAVGVKELIGLSPALIEERFNLASHEGAARFAGAPSNGLMGGGFLYTNRDSVSLGLVCGTGDIAHATKAYRKCWKILNSIRQYAL